MEVLWGLERLRHDGRPVCLALGMFDGVHPGHQEVLTRTRESAAASGGRGIVLTFDPHPQRVIAPPPEPILLTTIEERLALFESLGMGAAVVIRFDERLRETSADRWIEMLADIPGLSGVFASSDYTFGRDRGGTVERLRAGGERLGFAVTIIPPVHVLGTLVSSTLIRRLVRMGQVEEATVFLGRPYGVSGQVVEGERRGGTLGFPTANLAVHPDKVLPARGIYAAWARLEGRENPAAVSIGTRPTFGQGTLLVEAHLLDFDGDLYGQNTELLFVIRLRDELAFRTVPELVQQMERDVAKTREVLGRFRAG